jgi:hypothetical protein
MQQVCVAGQVGTEKGDGVVAGNQQQQPLQSVPMFGSGPQVHAEASGVELEASGALVSAPESTVPAPLLLDEELEELDELEAPLLDELEELVVPPLLPLLDDELDELLLDVLASSDPLSSVADPAGVELLLQAASPTVDDAPMTTMTWKSFSIFMAPTLSPMREL